MMTDKIMAIAALATLITLLGVVAWFVPEIDLIIVIAFVSLLLLYGHKPAPEPLPDDLVVAV